MNNMASEIRSVAVTRYVTPLREGGSLPALVEADDGFLYVLKFRGAGQGVKALVAELIAGQLAKLLGFRMPEIVYAHLDEAFGRTEADEEIQDLLRASEGLNLGIHYLSGAITFDAVINTVDPLLSSQVVWLDSLITNVDRTARNTNMLIWHKDLWLIDHGAAFYFHHSGSDPKEHALKPFTQIKDHVLLPWAAQLEAVDAAYKVILTDARLKAIVDTIPEAWLSGDFPFEQPEQNRNMYFQFLKTRVENSEIFVKEAIHARKALI
ncbi:MAG TPA: HipA family kinase [Cytophagales bacterium]|nr:HipA family kinase [Cytophagales bacterium]